VKIEKQHRYAGHACCYHSTKNSGKSSYPFAQRRVVYELPEVVDITLKSEELN
jgi:hypothetical protein